MDTLTQIQTIEQIYLTTEQLSDVQETAIDLYRRGFNVFPLPSAQEWHNRSGYAENPNKKPPYLAEPLFHSRLHLCSKECRHKPLLFDLSLQALFFQANIGIMMGRTSGNLLAIDCDSQEAFEKIGAELIQQNLPFWAITSHRGGAYLLRTSEGEVDNMSETCFKDVQVWGYRHYIVIPPSIHPQGTVYQWNTPEPRNHIPSGMSIPPISVTALEWLGVKLQRGKWEEPELFGLPEWASVLSYNNRETLANGALDGQRNAKLMREAYDMAGCRLPYELSENALLESAGKCIPEYPIRDTLAILKSAYKKRNVKPAKEHTYLQTPSLCKEWEIAEKFASTFDWRAKYGRKAGSHRRVFLACVKRAQMENRTVFRASVREISDILVRDGKRILDTLRSLCKDDLLVFVSYAKSGASLYRFSDSVLHCYSEMPTVITPCSISVGISEHPKMTIPNTDAQKNAFVGLGPTAWYVWEYLVANPTHSRYAIAKALNLPKSSVYDAVERLISANLIIYNPAESLYFGEKATDSMLEILAVNLGTSNRSEKKRAQNKIEREIWLNLRMARARVQYARTQYKGKSQNKAMQFDDHLPFCE